MEFKPTPIPDLFEIFPRKFEDERGYFFESYNEQTFEQGGIFTRFVQDNQAFSKKGVLRGLHLQKPPYAQAKLVKVVSGRVLDVAVDVRPGSPTFGQHYTCMLTAEDQNMLLVPEGFAHGYSTLEDAIFTYKCSNFYHKASESGIIWNDTRLNIDWMINDPVISEKDLILPTFEEFVRMTE